MGKKDFNFPEWFKEYDGFLTAEDEFIDESEFHAIVIGAGTGFIGGIPQFAAVFGLVTGGKKLSGHLKDVKKEFAYTVGGFIGVEAIQAAIPVVQGVL